MVRAGKRSGARTAQIDMRRLVGRQMLPLAFVAIALWVFRDHLSGLDLTAIWTTLHQISIRQWGVAIAATAASFWAVGRYDMVLHGLLGTGISAHQARTSGASAIAIGQFAGFGVLTGALVRWRLLDELSLGRAIRISLAVSVSFLAGWAVVISVAILLADTNLAFLRPAAVAVLSGSAGLAALSIWQPKFLPRLPSLRALWAILLLAFMDTFFAGVALYVLLPQGLAPDVVTFFAVFLISLGAGLIGGTPGGIGPFEVALVALLPAVPSEPLLAAALGFRLVYHVLLAALSMVVLFRGTLRPRAPTEPNLSAPFSSPYLPPQVERALWAAPRAEVNLLRQGDFGLLSSHVCARALAAPVGQSLIMIADPIGPGRETAAALHALCDVARTSHRAPMLYKCAARTAVVARQIGWRALPVAQEAWISPQDFSTQGSSRRQLRRLLRKASASGVALVEGGRTLLLSRMRQVADDWSARHGGERGFSMGTFDADYVSCQRVFLAWKDDTLVGFLTLHEVQNEWTLDLMRQSRDAPDGTMHLLVVRAIESAAALNCPRLSLAAVPQPWADGSSELFRLLQYALKISGDAQGLRRFKSCFAPNWQPLYAAAPSTLSLATGLWDVLRHINRNSGARRE
jgi:phosphatidylglycerol lysyltransferase